jgi:predicted lysophospholipase L1 biosynthesis ABC-type transport system permease subunit
MKNKAVQILVILVIALVIGQVVALGLNYQGYLTFLVTLRVVISQLAFWGPIIALIAAVFVAAAMRLLGFKSLDEIRAESVEQNNPTPAIIFVGVLVASLQFLALVIRP